MKRLFALLFALIITSTSTALAAKARSISSDADSSFHAKHLALHIGESSCHATGNYIKTRSQSNKDKVIGHLEQADVFELLEVKNGFALIQVTSSHKTSPDSWEGMTGWIDSDYIDCTCSSGEYANQSSAPANNSVSSKVEDFIGTTSVICTGNNLRVRNKPNGKTILGHLEKADEFILLDVQNGWAQITVTKAATTSPDSWNGLSGWVSAEYLKVNKNAQAIPEAGNGYAPILDFFYQAISEKWDNDRIAAADFEPYEFPDDLNESGFLYRDINADGIDELFVFRSYEAEIGPVIAGYTLVNGHPVRLFSSWARSRNYLCADGSIYNEGSNGAAYSVYYVYDLIGSQLAVREGVLSGDYEEDGETKYGWFLVDERADFSYSEHKLISDDEADQRIAFYQNSVVHQFDNLITFAEYKKTTPIHTPAPTASVNPSSTNQSNSIIISGNGTNLYDKAFSIPFDYIRCVSKRSINYNINSPEVTLYYSDKDTGKTKSRWLSIPENGTAYIIRGPLDILYYTSESECDWEVEFSPIHYTEQLAPLMGNGSYVSDMFALHNKPKVLNLAFTNNGKESGSIDVSWGIVYPNGSAELNGSVVGCRLSPNSTKQYREIIVPTDIATAYYLTIHCTADIYWEIIPD